ncbi:MAG: hypothetical protein E7641_07190 [Ruminococcaceae bacterium]|nr:hypothetical protein [Oscillospiraceae bacterium]
MAKKLSWTATLEGEEHNVSLVYSFLTGKAIVNIDGMEFDISVGFMKLRGTNQVFKLGDEAAMLDFPKKGEPEVYVGGVGLRSGREYNG